METEGESLCCRDTTEILVIILEVCNSQFRFWYSYKILE